MDTRAAHPPELLTYESKTCLYGWERPARARVVHERRRFRSAYAGSGNSDLEKSVSTDSPPMGRGEKNCLSVSGHTEPAL
jgi:hypothetical protein